MQRPVFQYKRRHLLHCCDWWNTTVSMRSRRDKFIKNTKPCELDSSDEITMHQSFWCSINYDCSSLFLNVSTDCAGNIFMETTSVQVDTTERERAPFVPLCKHWSTHPSMLSAVRPTDVRLKMQKNPNFFKRRGTLHCVVKWVSACKQSVLTSRMTGHLYVRGSAPDFSALFAIIDLLWCSCTWINS